MQVDHIFIFVDSKKDANILKDIGLLEGSGNIHKGIGTANRRFFFDGFYLEILWVEDESECKALKEIELFKRYEYKKSGYSRFGICMENTPQTNELFKDAFSWDAPFLPKNNPIDILTSETMPWIFRLPPNRSANNLEEPRAHKLGLSKLTKVTFYQNGLCFENSLEFLGKNSIVEFKKDTKNSLVLEFDNFNQGKTLCIKEFDLTINY